MEINKLANKLPPHIESKNKIFLRLNIRKISDSWRISYENSFGEDSIVHFSDTLSGAIRKMIGELKI